MLIGKWKENGKEWTENPPLYGREGGLGGFFTKNTEKRACACISQKKAVPLQPILICGSVRAFA